MGERNADLPQVVVTSTGLTCASSPVVQEGVGGCLLWQGLLKQGPSNSASQGGAHHQMGERLVESHQALCEQQPKP